MGWVVAVGLAALVGLALGPALAGSASASPTTAASPLSAASTQWAYGGQGYSNGTTTLGASTWTWNATFGWTVIYTATNTLNSTVELEEQRTVGVSLTTSFTAPNASATYTYFGSESDLAFVNLTDNATVEANGVSVAALGISNASLTAQTTVREALVMAIQGHGHSAYLNVSGAAQAQIDFAPALGLIPLNLSAAPQWNSTATATPSANWSFAYAWIDHGWNGTVGSGSGTSSGNWTASVPVSVQGTVVANDHVFRDHRPRVAIVLRLSGPVDLADGFVLIPHGFDLFGGATHRFDTDGFGSASVGYGSGETLFVSPSARGPIVSAAATTFGATMGRFGTLGAAPGGAPPLRPHRPAPGRPSTVSR